MRTNNVFLFGSLLAANALSLMGCSGPNFSCATTRSCTADPDQTDGGTGGSRAEGTGGAASDGAAGGSESRGTGGVSAIDGGPAPTVGAGGTRPADDVDAGTGGGGEPGSGIGGSASDAGTRRMPTRPNAWTRVPRSHQHPLPRPILARSATRWRRARERTRRPRCALVRKVTRATVTQLRPSLLYEPLAGKPATCGVNSTCTEIPGGAKCGCESGFASCDGSKDTSTGCETAVADDDAKNCGACGLACAGSVACSSGASANRPCPRSSRRWGDARPAHCSRPRPGPSLAAPSTAGGSNDYGQIGIADSSSPVEIPKPMPRAERAARE